MRDRSFRYDGVSDTVYDAYAWGCCSTPSNGFDYTGKVTLDLVAGQTYGFSLYGSNFDSSMILDGTLKVSAVPEASTWTMMMFGLAGLGFAGVRRATAARWALAA